MAKKQNINDWEKEVLNALSVIIDPDLNKDIVSLGFIKELTISDKGDVSFKLELTTPACPVKDHFVAECRRLIADLPWSNQIEITLSAQGRINPLQKQHSGLERVKSIVAISSCKGGVGKSTATVNLAFTLASSGAKVGIFDADIYGPSLPTMVAGPHSDLVMDGKLIKPVDYNGVKLMSFGYTQEPGQQRPAVLRGAMVTQIINQLLTGTDWGELDYLLIDMPPGTGDIQLTLCQVVPLTAAVIVTTPQYISFIDVVKGIEMFDNLKVPTVGVIENMSYIDIDENKRLTPFGEGALKQLVSEFGFKNAVAIPLFEDISRAGDNGVPYVVHDPNSHIAKLFQEFTDSIVREISKVIHGGFALPKVSFDPKNGILLQEGDNKPQFINAKELRLACNSALNKDEFTGESKVDASDIPESIHPLSMNPVGNYALGINWSDGHSSLFPYDVLLSLVH